MIASHTDLLNAIRVALVSKTEHKGENVQRVQLSDGMWRYRTSYRGNSMHSMDLRVYPPGRHALTSLKSVKDYMLSLNVVHDDDDAHWDALLPVPMPAAAPPAQAPQASTIPPCAIVPHVASERVVRLHLAGVCNTYPHDKCRAATRSVTINAHARRDAACYIQRMWHRHRISLKLRELSLLRSRLKATFRCIASSIVEDDHENSDLIPSDDEEVDVPINMSRTTFRNYVQETQDGDRRKWVYEMTRSVQLMQDDYPILIASAALPTSSRRFTHSGELYTLRFTQGFSTDHGMLIRKHLSNKFYEELKISDMQNDHSFRIYDILHPTTGVVAGLVLRKWKTRFRGKYGRCVEIVSIVTRSDQQSTGIGSVLMNVIGDLGRNDVDVDTECYLVAQCVKSSFWSHRFDASRVARAFVMQMAYVDDGSIWPDCTPRSYIYHSRDRRQSSESESD